MPLTALTAAAVVVIGERIATDAANASSAAVNTSIAAAQVQKIFRTDRVQEKIRACRGDLSEVAGILRTTVALGDPMDPQEYEDLRDERESLSAKTDDIEQRHQEPANKLKKFFRTRDLDKKISTVKVDTIVLKDKTRRSSDAAKMLVCDEHFRSKRVQAAPRLSNDRTISLSPCDSGSPVPGHTSSSTHAPNTPGQLLGDVSDDESSNMSPFSDPQAIVLRRWERSETDLTDTIPEDLAGGGIAT